jgi:hypothetical protein
VVAVVTGVSLAVGFAAVVPLEWWSLGVLIFVSITIGQVLHLRSNLIEVAISGMLVLGVGALGAQPAAGQRIAETLVGAAVGMAANLLFPPKVASADAGRAIDGLAEAVSGLLLRAADEMAEMVGSPGGGSLAAPARMWLDEARRITHDIPQVGAALVHAEQSRKLNVRAVGTADVGPGLRQGLEALEHSAVAIRSMFRALMDATYDVSWPDDDTRADIVLGLAQTLREMAAGIGAFGQLVRDEADPTRRLTSADVEALREAITGLHEARARLEEQLSAGVAPEIVEPHAAVLSTVKRLLGELDLDQRIRRQVRLGRPVRTRHHPRPATAESAEPEESTPDAETQLMPRSHRERRDRPGQ